MWLEILCGLVIYKLFRGFFSDHDDILDVEASDSEAIFLVAKRLKSIYSGKVYFGLRIPDADTGSQLDIDMVAVTKGEVVLISVKNFSGFASIDADGTWVCTSDGKHKVERHPDPVEETKRKLGVLESYLEQRGVIIPKGYLSFRVVLPNLEFRPLYPNCFPPEVVTHDQLKELKPEWWCVFYGWIKGAFSGRRKDAQESIHQKVNFVLSTAPMWDRLELKGDKCILGEFLEFKGNTKDTDSLREIKRSKVKKLVIQKFSMFGLAPSKVQVVYSARDYRSEGSSWDSEWMELTVRSSTEVVFQLKASRKTCKFKLSKVVSLSLGA